VGEATGVTVAARVPVTSGGVTAMGLLRGGWQGEAGRRGGARRPGSCGRPGHSGCHAGPGDFRSGMSW